MDFRKNINDYRKLKFDPHFPFEDIDGYRDKVQKEIQEKRIKFLELESAVGETPKNIVSVFKDCILKSISNCLDKINGNVNGLPLSKNQATIIEGRVYAKFIEFIYHSLASPSTWDSNMYYSDDIKDQLDSKMIEKLLTDSRNDIRSIDFETYLELEERVEKLIEDIKQLWQKDVESKY